jgi:hypothetical protein
MVTTMTEKLMILSATDPREIRLVRVPDDYEEHEAYRHVTGMIAAIEENDADYGWDDIEAALSDEGFESVDFILGPALD